MTRPVPAGDEPDEDPIARFDPTFAVPAGDERENDGRPALPPEVVAYDRAYLDGYANGKRDYSPGGLYAGVHLTGDALDVERLAVALRSIHHYSHDGHDPIGSCLDPIGSSNEDAAAIAAAYAGVHLTGDERLREAAREVEALPVHYRRNGFASGTAWVTRRDVLRILRAALTDPKGSPKNDHVGGSVPAGDERERRMTLLPDWERAWEAHVRASDRPSLITREEHFAEFMRAAGVHLTGDERLRQLGSILDNATEDDCTPGFYADLRAALTEPKP